MRTTSEKNARLQPTAPSRVSFPLVLHLMIWKRAYDLAFGVGMAAGRNRPTPAMHVKRR